MNEETRQAFHLLLSFFAVLPAAPSSILYPLATAREAAANVARHRPYDVLMIIFGVELREESKEHALRGAATSYEEEIPR